MAFLRKLFHRLYSKGIFYWNHALQKSRVSRTYLMEWGLKLKAWCWTLGSSSRIVLNNFIIKQGWLSPGWLVTRKLIYSSSCSTKTISELIWPARIFGVVVQWYHHFGGFCFDGEPKKTLEKPTLEMTVSKSFERRKWGYKMSQEESWRSRRRLCGHKTKKRKINFPLALLWSFPNANPSFRSSWKKSSLVSNFVVTQRMNFIALRFFKLKFQLSSHDSYIVPYISDYSFCRRQNLLKIPNLKYLFKFSCENRCFGIPKYW